MRRRGKGERAFFRVACLTAIVVAGLACGREARASSSGISGASGKQAFDCSSFCHGGGVAPEVSFDAPSTVPPGATVTIRFKVVSQAPDQQVAAGFNVAATGGVLDVLPEPGGVWKLDDEVTHDAPKANDAGGSAFWDFTWTAPDEAGDFVLYGAGNSVNGNGNTAGDFAATTSVALRVSDVPAPAPAPAASLPALLAILVALVLTGGRGLRRQRRQGG